MNAVVDIGCGTGNITADISAKLQHKSIIAFDISQPMIDYACSHYPDKTVKYVVSDICSDWQDLEEATQVTRDSIDLVISIYCLHWVDDKQKAMENVSKMLKPGTFLTSLSI